MSRDLSETKTDRNCCNRISRHRNQQPSLFGTRKRGREREKESSSSSCTASFRSSTKVSTILWTILVAITQNISPNNDSMVECFSCRPRYSRASSSLSPTAMVTMWRVPCRQTLWQKQHHGDGGFDELSGMDGGKSDAKSFRNTGSARHPSYESSTPVWNAGGPYDEKAFGAGNGDIDPKNVCTDRRTALAAAAATTTTTVMTGLLSAIVAQPRAPATIAGGVASAVLAGPLPSHASLTATTTTSTNRGSSGVDEGGPAPPNGRSTDEDDDLVQVDRWL